MDLETNTSAKIAYLLSTCHRFNNSFMSSVIRQYEESFTVGGRHHFSFNITLHEPDGKSDLDDFAVKNASFNFLESDSPIMYSLIQKHNNDILHDDEMIQIYNNVVAKNIQTDIHHITGIYAVASLLKMYQYQYKNVFIPVTLDYGRNHNLLHQCAIVVNNTDGILMFYEPYGKYMKYNKSYANCIKDFLHVFTPVLDSKFFTGGELNYQTFHRHINTTIGIQQIIMNANNSHKDTFDQEYKDLVTEIDSAFPAEKFSDFYSVLDPNDNTMVILDLLFNMDKTSVDSVLDQEKYKALLNKTLQYYYQYNSKTCVTITIVELNEYFKLVQSNADTTTGMQQYYSKFTGSMPNKELMSQIYALINLFNNNKLIEKMIVDRVNSFQICKDFLN
jgi:hypothetical protein